MDLPLSIPGLSWRLLRWTYLYQFPDFLGGCIVRGKKAAQIDGFVWFQFVVTGTEQSSSYLGAPSGARGAQKRLVN